MESSGLKASQESEQSLVDEGRFFTLDPVPAFGDLLLMSQTRQPLLQARQ